MVWQDLAVCTACFDSAYGNTCAVSTSPDGPDLAIIVMMLNALSSREVASLPQSKLEVSLCWDPYSLSFKDERHNGLEQQDAESNVAARRPEMGGFAGVWRVEFVVFERLFSPVLATTGGTGFLQSGHREDDGPALAGSSNRSHA